MTSSNIAISRWRTILHLPQMAETKPPQSMDATRKCLLYDEYRTNHSNKEIYHVVHHYRNSNHPVVAWLFRFEHKPEFPKNRRVDPHSGCSCRHPHHSESVRDHLVLRFFENWRQPDTLPLHTKEKYSRNESICD